MKHENRYFWLDLIRGICALAVFFSHLRSVVIVDYPNLSQQANVLQKAFYFGTGFGHQAVVVFFVLSGFFVGGSIINAGTKFSWKSYVVSRLTRLWIVLIPALAFTTVVDLAIKSASPGVLDGEYRNIWNSGPGVGGNYSIETTTLFGNLLFLQTILVPVYGTNSPLWSLANEFWYYVTFPLVYFGAKYFRRPCFFLLLLLGLFIIALLPGGIKSGFLIWIFGVILALVKIKSRPVICCFASAGAVLTIGSLVYARTADHFLYPWFSTDYLVGLGFSIFCIGVIGASDYVPKNRAIQNSVRLLSELSYTLYLFHFPLVVLVGSLIYKSNKISPGVNGLAQFFGFSIILFVICCAFYWLFERNTDQVRKRVSSLVGK